MDIKTLESQMRQLRRQAMEVDYPSPELDAIHAQMQIIQSQIKDLKAAQPVGPFSGLTRRELAATGTCETDWF